MFSNILRQCRQTCSLHSTKRNGLDTLYKPTAIQTILHNHEIHTGHSLQMLDKDVKNKKRLIESAHKAKEEDITGETDQTVDIDGLTEVGITIPTQETHAMLIDGVRFDELPIAHIKSSPNNTIITVTDFTGNKIARSSCGQEGFKHVKKSTNVAAQATGLAVGTKSMKHGITNLRVILKGLGAGRLPSVKGLQMAGLNIVSLTDETPTTNGGRRPRKARRL